MEVTFHSHKDWRLFVTSPQNSSRGRRCSAIAGQAEGICHRQQICHLAPMVTLAPLNHDPLLKPITSLTRTPQVPGSPPVRGAAWTLSPVLGGSETRAPDPSPP